MTANQFADYRIKTTFGGEEEREPAVIIREVLPGSTANEKASGGDLSVLDSEDEGGFPSVTNAVDVDAGF